MSLQILSAIQFRPRFARCRADVMDNFRHMEPLIRKAESLGTGFLVLPELCLTGYSFMSKEEASEVAELSDGPTYSKMRGVAQALSSYVSFGYVEVDPVDGSLYNSATMLAPNGKIVTSYRKVNLFSNDFLWARPGLTSAPVVVTEYGKTGLVVCRDLRDKIPSNIPRREIRTANSLFDGQAVDLVAACVNWGKGGFPSTSWMDFVADNKCTLVVANRFGMEAREDFGQFEQEFGHGGSAIVEADWNVHIGGLKFGEDCVVTAAL